MLNFVNRIERISKSEYEDIHRFAFSNSNKGYNPKVIESPNGDGIWDEDKKYAHIAPKYFKQMGLADIRLNTLRAMHVYYKAFKEAKRVCNFLDLPKDFYPSWDSTLRVLDYPAGATTAPHKDFDLFTLCLYRDDENAFKYLDGEEDGDLQISRNFFPGIHFGELMTEVTGAKATEHEVIATENRQLSAVFFVVPDHRSILPSGISVGEWLSERKNRSRK